ncbi:MAG TPA: MFS transporter [Ruminococcaceae bacterium]|nr:MFS transporter [Oscillospiraceae bacterium]
MLKTKESQTWRQNAALFMLSQSISLLGSSIVQMAIIWRVTLDTSSGVWAMLLTFSSTLPQMILSFFGGVWADRYPRKRLIILADAGIAAATIVLIFAFLTWDTARLIPLMVIISALRSLGTGIQSPAVSAAIPQLVPEKHLMRYNGINGSVTSVIQFAAPAAAAALLAVGPFHWLLMIDVATAIAGILILSFVKLESVKLKRTEQKSTFFAELKAGISYAAEDRPVRRLLLSYGAFIFLAVPSGFLVVLMIERTFGDNYTFLTIAEMLGSLGMVLGGLLLGAWGGFKNRNKTLLFGLLCYGAFSIALGMSYTFWLFAAFLFLASFFIPIVMTATTTMLQERAPEEKQGRVFGLFGAIYSGFLPLGMALFGPLADVVEIQSMVIVCGGLLLLLGLMSFRKGGQETDRPRM